MSILYTSKRTKQKIYYFREGTFLVWGGGGRGPGIRRGGSLVKFLQIEEGQTCFVHSWGRVTLFLASKKNYSMSLLLKSTFLFYLPSL